MKLQAVLESDFKYLDVHLVDEAIRELDLSEDEKEKLLSKNNVSEVVTDLLATNNYQACIQLLTLCIEESICFKWALQTVKAIYVNYQSSDDEIALNIISKTKDDYNAINPDLIKHLLSDLDLHLIIKWLLIAKSQLGKSDENGNIDTAYIVNLIFSELAEFVEDQDSYYTDVVINGIYHALGEVEIA